MSASVTSEQALHWLQVQLEGLNEVRNLDVRNPSFRQWRQNTLTILQRIWPDDEARHHRFKKVPFSPPSSKSDDRFTRDLYERGCAEARRLLTAWIGEVSTSGVVASRTAGERAGAPDAAMRTPAPPRASDPAPARPHAEKVAARGAERTPGNGARAGERPTKAGKRSRPKLKDMLGLNELSLVETEGGEPPPQRSTPAEPPRLELVRGPSAMDGPPPAAATIPAAPVDSSAQAPGGPSAPPPGDALGASIADAIEIASVGSLADAIAEATSGLAETPSPPPTAQALPSPPVAPPDDIDITREAGPRLEATAIAPPRPPRTGEDLLQRSAPSLGSYAARSFVALAADVEDLGVPAAHCERVRAALLDFAPRLDHGPMAWAQVSDVVALVMQYPELGRRALPLLLPHIYSAAA